MIRLMGLVDLRPVHQLKGPAYNEEAFYSANEDVSHENIINKNVNLTEADHEVSMAQNALDDIIKNATELKNKIGENEKDIPAWIQDHITQAANFISQAATNYHEHDKPEDTPTELEEKAPEGWEKTVKAMKKHKEIDNPFALAQYMKKKGYTSHKENSLDEVDLEEERKTGETWKTASGKTATKNSDGSITYTSDAQSGKITGAHPSNFPAHTKKPQGKFDMPDWTKKKKYQSKF